MLELLSVVQTFLDAERENVRRFETPWRRRLWLYRHGFLSSRDAVWDLSPETVDEYLSDLQVRATGRIDSPHGVLLANKGVFHMVVEPTHGHLLPEVLGVVRDGRLAEGPLGGVTSFEGLVDLLAERWIVAKPVTAAKGAGVRVLDRQNGRVRIDGQPVTRGELVSTLSEGTDRLLTEYVTSAAYAADVYPHSTNTIRLLTMIDPETDDPFVATAAHRFGRAASGHLDNWSAGGLSAGVDLRTGELGTAIAPPDASGSVRRMDSHPDTGARIAGTTVPGWERVKERVLDLAGTYAWLWPYVGWDVVVTDDDGSVTVLEGNRKSVDADQQAHDPLLADERARRFFDHHGVLSTGAPLLS